MNKLTQALMEELTVEYVKVGSLQIPESVVISWVIMLLLVVGSILLTRNLKVDHISKRQAALEALYSLGKNFFEGLLGKEGSRYVPYLMTVALYIACSNVIGVFGVKPPTKDLDVTAALALMSIVLIEYAGVRARGGAGFLKSLAAPTPIMTPMNILEIAIRPTSLCMRLFGNVLGAFVIMELLKLVVPVFVPAVFSLYFDLFDGLILYVLLRKFLFKPIQNVLDQRQKTIEADIAAAQTSKTEAAAALTTAQDKLRNVDNEAAARREAYEKQAEVEKQQLLADAQKQADEIVAAGKAAVEIERQNKLREADAQATALARSMCEKLLKHNLTAQDDDQLLDDLLQKAGAGNGN